MKIWQNVTVWFSIIPIFGDPWIFVQSIDEWIVDSSDIAAGWMIWEIASQLSSQKPSQRTIATYKIIIPPHRSILHKIKSHLCIAKFLMWTWEAWQSWLCVYWGGIRVCHLLYIFASVRLRVFLLVLLRLPKSLPVLILLLFNLHD